jgi:4-hydroxy-tetrahydrodipicolinate synthase
MSEPSSGAGRVKGAQSSGAWLAGVVPPVCTPLTADLEVDAASFERLLGFLLDSGVRGLFVLGSSSEAAYLRDDQRDTVAEIAAKTAAGSVPVLVGAIDMTTARVVDHARRAVASGADAIVATSPFYAQVTHPDEIARHFRAVKAACGVPLVAYDIPIAVHSKLAPKVVAGLATEEVIDGLKDSSGDLRGLREVIVATHDATRFAILTGSEVLVDCAMLIGADGAVPGLANVDPHGYVALYSACCAGDWERASGEQERLMRLLEITACADPARMGASGSVVGGYKTALMLMGLIATNAVALPQTALNDREVAAVREVLIATGLV